MTVAELITYLEKLPQDLIVVYATDQSNLQGWVTADSLSIIPAGYGQAVIIQSDQIPHN